MGNFMLGVYVIGPYRAKTPWLVEENIREAERIAKQIADVGDMRMKMGKLAIPYPVCVHSMYRFFNGTGSDKFWLEACQQTMEFCDAFIVLPNWENSEGSIAEVERAKNIGEVFYPDNAWHVGNGFLDWLEKKEQHFIDMKAKIQADLPDFKAIMEGRDDSCSSETQTHGDVQE